LRIRKLWISFAPWGVTMGKGGTGVEPYQPRITLSL
jgi:hypothetical protein